MLNLNELTRGDRVLLRCPESTAIAKREAIFEGVFRSAEDVLRDTGRELLVGAVGGMRYVNGQPFAVFQFGKDGRMGHIMCLGIQADGTLLEPSGMQVLIESKLTMGQG